MAMEELVLNRSKKCKKQRSYEIIARSQFRLNKYGKFL
jgi:hypothetical protein